ncbi:MAG: radical SAM protein [Enterocloster asparagiformis]|nr:radical SAM protein [Enterocloster asparagiformis]
MTNRQKKPLELYIHIPFCARKCLYCDFLSFRTLASVHRQYVDQLIREIEAEGASCQEYRVVTVFIGGGTPSVLEPDMIRDICLAVRRSFDVAQDAEITIEVNPGTLLQNKLHIYRAAGINRVSIGLQSADNRELENLGRIHSFEEFLKSFQCARMAGFANINVDLMSGIPGQTLDSWRNTLKKVTMLKPEHISAYSLIIEEGTPFWDRYGAGEEKPCRKSAPPAGTRPGEDPDRFGLRRRDYPELPDEEAENRIYHLTRTFLAEQGYERYEISNYARPGFECRHNVGYWTEVEYLGLGLGSSSFLGGCRFCNQRDLEQYLALDFAAEDWAGRLRPQFTRLSREARMEEFMFLGLRMIRGISEIDFVATFGVKLDSVYGPVIERLVENGLLRREGVWLALTEWGMDVSNYVLSEFLLTST